MKIFAWVSVVSFAVGSVCDLITTILGIADILGDGLLAVILGAAATVVVMVLNSRTRDVFVEKQWWLLPFCILALIFDFYTSVAGEQYLPSDMQGIVVSTPLGWITLVFIAFFFVTSPMLLLDSVRKLNL
jgi:hypothetical protein